MSEDDDSESELTASISQSAKRTKYDRRSKTPKIYEDPGSEGADDETGANVGSFGRVGNGIESIFDQDFNLDGACEKVGSFSARRKVVEEDTMSDISDFKPAED